MDKYNPESSLFSTPSILQGNFGNVKKKLTLDLKLIGKYFFGKSNLRGICYWEFKVIGKYFIGKSFLEKVSPNPNLHQSSISEIIWSSIFYQLNL